jgi:hypothetical protein
MSAHLRKLSRQFRNMRRLLLAMLREVFDEAAYERFLIRYRETANVETYSAFCRDREELTLRRPRCC